MEYLNFMENKNKRKQLGQTSYILTVKNSDIRSGRRFAVSNRSKLLSIYLKAHLTYQLQILFQVEHNHCSPKLLLNEPTLYLIHGPFL